MGVQAVLGKASLRRAGWGVVGVVLVLALGLGAALTAIEAADRTVSAYPDYLERNDVADLVVNPVLANERTAEIMASIPGVRRVVSDSLLTAGPVDSGPEDNLFLQFRVSQDGRYTKQDRPVVRDGRMIESGDEVFLSVAAAEELDADVGDVLDIGFFGVNPVDPTSSDVGPMVHEADLTVVGIGTFADGVLPDELFPRQYALVTPEAAGTADCLQDVPDPDDTRSSEVLLVASVPTDCAMTYRYWSLDVEGGQDAAAGVAAELGQRFQEENANLPASMRESGAGYFVIPAFTGDDARAVSDALSPAVASLRVFGIVAGLIAVGAALGLVVRQLRRRDEELDVWRGLGMQRPTRALTVALVPGVAVAVGVLGALVVAAVASPVGPVASARALEPHPDRSLGTVALLAALAALVLLALGIGGLAWRHAAHRRPVAVARARRVPGASASPLTGLGIRAAVQGRDAIGAAIGTAVAVAAVTATLLYALAIQDLVNDPDRYGWTFDEAVMVNYGYGPVDLGQVGTDLDRPDVDHWAGVALSGDFTIDGETVPVIAGRVGFERIIDDLPVVEGTRPEGEDELALGEATAGELGVEVGDEVTVASPFGEHDATVTGLVVLPDLGPFQSDRTSLATGAVLPGPLMVATYGNAQEATGLSGEDLADSQVAAVLVDLADGAAPITDELEGLADSWGAAGFSVVYGEPVRSATIVDLDAVRGLPSVLAGLFALAMAGAVVAGLASCFRTRRVELAVVRALGATRRQRRTSLRVQALATAAFGTVVGLPVGVVVARLAFRRLVEDIGVVDDLAVAVGLVLAVGLAAVVIALLAAEVLARLTMSSRPPEALAG